MVQMAQLEPRAKKVKVVNREFRGPRVKKVKSALLATPGQPEALVPQAQKAKRARLAHKVFRVLRVKRGKLAALD